MKSSVKSYYVQTNSWLIDVQINVQGQGAHEFFGIDYQEHKMP